MIDSLACFPTKMRMTENSKRHSLQDHAENNIKDNY